MPYVGRVGLLGLGTAAWLMAALVLMGRSRSRRPRVQRACGPSAPE